jgi:hypothetical protein
LVDIRLQDECRRRVAFDFSVRINQYLTQHAQTIKETFLSGEEVQSPRAAFPMRP